MNDIRDVPMSAVAVAPLGGGPSTPDLVIEAARNGALAFLAAAYKTGDQVHAEIEAVRAATAAPFGVNLFVPGQPTRDRHSLERYLDGLRREGYALGEPT